jgi:hypothetical protein
MSAVTPWPRTDEAFDVGAGPTLCVLPQETIDSTLTA